MAFQQVIAPTTSAVSTKADLPDSSLWPSIVIAADNLATTEVFTVFYKLPTGNYAPAPNQAGTAAGGTATVAGVVLPGGPQYAVTKSATAGACGVYFTGCGHY